jgi:hypothetical protein
MVGGRTVAVRSSYCDCRDDDASDNNGGDWNASDGAAHHWCWSSRWCWRGRVSAGLSESLNRNQAQDCCGSEKFFHYDSFDSIGNVASVFIGALIL